MGYICEKLGLPCPYASWSGNCQSGHCIMQTDDETDIDELDLFDMLDEEEE